MSWTPSLGDVVIILRYRGSIMGGVLDWYRKRWPVGLVFEVEKGRSNYDQWGFDVRVATDTEEALWRLKP